MEIQENLHSMVEDDEEAQNDMEEKLLTQDTITEVLTEIGIADQTVSRPSE